MNFFVFLKFVFKLIYPDKTDNLVFKLKTNK